MSDKRFRIAFSFAGEKREFVSQVAAILAARFGEEKILYDKFHRAEFARDDLAFYLPDLYNTETDLVVAVFCENYDQKEWCGLEWKAIFDMVKKRRSDELMLTRFGNVEGRGLFSLAGYIDLQGETSTSAAGIILERLALNEGNPKNYYAKPLIAGGGLPAIAWPNQVSEHAPDLANRDAEFEFFRSMIAGKTRERAMFVEAESNRGKTTFIRECARYCQTVFPTEAFVTVDFNANPSREWALETLRLDLISRWKLFAPVASTTLDLRTDLRTFVDPVILLFDTYEKASLNAQDLVVGLLLSDLEKLPAVRIIVAGQKIPEHSKALWANRARRFLLGPINDPQHWERIRNNHYPDLNSDHILAVTFAAGGDPGIIRAGLQAVAEKLRRKVP